MLNQQSGWVVNTNSNTCKIYHYCKKPISLALVKEINHPENKLRDIELTSAKPGHYQSKGSAHGAYSQPSDPKEIKIEAFSKEIATVLDHGRNSNNYQYLIVIAAPHMHGLLLQQMNKHVKSLITHHIEKDLIGFSENQLLDFLREHTKYSDES